MGSEPFFLSWDNFHKNMSTGLHSLLENEDLVDVTLAMDGQYLRAHKMVLSVCSPYFCFLFNMNPCKHPIVFMRDVSYSVMSDLLTFMYKGEVQVNHEDLPTFIKTAEALQIKGLTKENVQSDEPEVKPLNWASSAINDSTQHDPTSQTTSASSSIVETARDETITSDTIVQVKIEPYTSATDLEQFIKYEDNQIDNSYIDETAVEMPPDDDYSMIEEDDESQEGTSGDVNDTHDILEADKITSINSLNEKSKKKYEAIYRAFIDWRSTRKLNSFSENVLLAYFVELSEKYKSSYLWSQYSILRSTLSINHNINIENYSKLRALLKCKAEGYRAKKTKTFTEDEINKFIIEAPDKVYLATKDRS